MRSHRRHGDLRRSRSRSRDRNPEIRKRAQSRDNDNNVSSKSNKRRESDSDEYDERQRKKTKKKRRFYSGSDNEEIEDFDDDERKKKKKKRDDDYFDDDDDDDGKTTTGNAAKAIPQFGYVPRERNPNGKQSIPKHPQSIVMAQAAPGGVSIESANEALADRMETDLSNRKKKNSRFDQKLNNNSNRTTTTTAVKRTVVAKTAAQKARDARKWLLSQQISAYENLQIHDSETARKQRQVYVGNIPPEVDAEMLNVFLSSTLSAAFPEYNSSNQELIEDIKMSADKKYCFAIVIDSEMATSLFAINGVDLCGYTLMIARPSGWTDPKLMKDKADIAYEQLKLLHAEERAELGDAAAAAFLPLPPQPKKNVIVRLKNIAIEDDLKDDEEFEDLKLDVCGECEKFGELSEDSNGTIILPRKGLFVGSAFAKFKDEESALKAKEGMHGRAFDGRTIDGTFASEADYEIAVKTV